VKTLGANYVEEPAQGRGFIIPLFEVTAEEKADAVPRMRMKNIRLFIVVDAMKKKPEAEGLEQIVPVQVVPTGDAHDQSASPRVR